MTAETRRISWPAKCIVNFSGLTSIMGCAFIAVGIFGFCFLLGELLSEREQSWNILVFLGGFAFIGSMLILQDRTRVKKKLNLMREGLVVSGTFESKRKKVTASDSDEGGVSTTYVYIYRFDSEGRKGRYASTEIYRNPPPPQEVTILYSAIGNETVILDLEPGRMWLEESTIKAPIPFCMLVLLSPLSVVAAIILGALQVSYSL